MKGIFDPSTIKVTELKSADDPTPLLDCGSCSECGWSGKLSDCEKEQEGNYEEGYVWAVYCPECEDGGCIENYYPSAESLAQWKKQIMIKHKKPFGIYHWDTFDNETLLVGEADTLEEAKKKVKDKYGDRIQPLRGADQVDIVDQAGNIVEKFRVT